MTGTDAPPVAGWNLALRFALEMAALVGIVLGGRELIDGTAGQIAGVVAASLAAAAWGLFNVPGDPSRSGAAPVPVSGVVRLCVEFDVLAFGAAGWLLAEPVAGVVVIALLVVHYVTSWSRVRWLLTHHG